MGDSVPWMMAAGDCSTVLLVDDTVVAAFCCVPRPNRRDAATLGIRCANAMGITVRRTIPVVAAMVLAVLPSEAEIPRDRSCDMRFAFAAVLDVYSESLPPSQSSSWGLS